MRIYLKLDDFEQVIGRAKLMSRKLRDDQEISETHKKRYELFAKYSTKLSNKLKRPDQDSDALKKLKQEILDNKPMHNKIWLLNKLEEYLS